MNGKPVEHQVEPRLLLSDFLRQNLGLTGTHVGCEHGVCGVCTILLDGEPVRSCLMLAVQADGRALDDGREPVGRFEPLNPLQEAFRTAHGLQCGFCTPGFLMTLTAFLRENPDPSEDEVRHALSGNLCRCTGYQHIVDAALLAAKAPRTRVPEIDALSESVKGWQERFAVLEPEVRAFVDEPGRFARVRREAGELANSYPDADARPPLFGLLLGVKDIFHIEGFPTRAGSKSAGRGPRRRRGSSGRRSPDGGRAPRREDGHHRVRLLLTRTDAQSGGTGARTECTPGGSSSGSAAAVAAGLCDVALGTQTIGSVGRPAAFCGVVGYKPSYDRISRQGLIALAPSVDHVGLFARDVDTIERAAAVVVDGWRSSAAVAGPGPGAVGQRSPAGSARQHRLAVPRGPYLDLFLSPEGREHFELCVKKLKDSGWGVDDLAVMPDFEAIVDRHRLLVAAECAEVHADWFARFESLYAPKTAELIRRGQTVSDSDVGAARAGRLVLRTQLERALDSRGFSFFISPPALGPAPAGLESTGDPVMNLPWSHSGCPRSWSGGVGPPVCRSDSRFPAASVPTKNCSPPRARSRGPSR